MHVIILLIITIPAFQILFNNFYFSMHDDQHIVRLFLLDQGIRQGSLFPRWVEGLGFGFGYPLYNFYPPLIYYLAEFFHLIGFSFIWSIKLMVVVGFILAAVGIFLFLKEIIGKRAAILGSTIYTYFFYHAVLVYVRGALAEFFTLAVIPFVFLFLHRIGKKLDLKNCLLFGISFAVLILTHPLIAFPILLFIGLSFLYLLFLTKRKLQFIFLFIIGLLVGLSLSSFFWLPSMMEKGYTLIDEILTRELANYKLHYVYPQQFWYSPWGYGGSVKGTSDGLTFQLGKIPLLLVAVSFILAFLSPREKKDYFFFFILFVFSLFMSTFYSSFIWDNIKYLWYLQFPWRFLTFTAFFISTVAAYSIFFLERVLSKKIIVFLTAMMIVVTIIKYQGYFRPQQLLVTDDKQRTSFEEVTWRISSTSYEFVPKGVKTKKTKLGTTTLAIEKKNLPKKPYRIIKGEAQVKVIKNNTAYKVFNVDISSPTIFQLNTFNFPGWTAYLNGKKMLINDRNDWKLITIDIPKGEYQLEFKFTDTPIRKVGNIVSTVSLIFILFFTFYQLKKMNS